MNENFKNRLRLCKKRNFLPGVVNLGKGDYKNDLIPDVRCRQQIIRYNLLDKKNKLKKFQKCLKNKKIRLIDLLTRERFIYRDYLISSNSPLNSNQLTLIFLT